MIRTAFSKASAKAKAITAVAIALRDKIGTKLNAISAKHTRSLLRIALRKRWRAMYVGTLTAPHLVAVASVASALAPAWHKGALWFAKVLAALLLVSLQLAFRLMDVLRRRWPRSRRD